MMLFVASQLNGVWIMENNGLVWKRNYIFQLSMHWEKSVCVGAGEGHLLTKAGTMQWI